MAPFLCHSKAKVQGLALSPQEQLRSWPSHSQLENPCVNTPGEGSICISPAAPRGWPWQTPALTSVVRPAGNGI